MVATALSPYGWLGLGRTDSRSNGICQVTLGTTPFAAVLTKAYPVGSRYTPIEEEFWWPHVRQFNHTVAHVIVCVPQIRAERAMSQW